MKVYIIDTLFTKNQWMLTSAKHFVAIKANVANGFECLIPKYSL